MTEARTTPWNRRVVLPAVGGFVLLSILVSGSVLRLGGVIDWPSRGLAIVLLVALLLPIGVLFARAIGEWSDSGWLKLFFPWL